MSDNGENVNVPAAPPDEEKEQRPEKEKRFSMFEPIAGIIFAIVCTIIFLGFPQIITIVFIGGRLIPTFDAEVIRSLWLPIILWCVFRVGVEVAYLIIKRYTKKLTIISLVGHALTAICTLIIFVSPRIVFWEYVDFIHRYFEDVARWFGNILAKPNLIILVVMLVVLIIESVTVIRKGKKEKEKEEKEAEDINKADKAGAEEAKPEAGVNQ